MSVKLVILVPGRLLAVTGRLMEAVPGRELSSYLTAVPGREVIMLGGDIHVSVDSEIQDIKSGTTIRHITTSPVTNHVSVMLIVTASG